MKNMLNKENNIDLTKLDIAIKYIERMAEGKNPVTNQDIIEETIVNDPNVIRCLFFIQDTLQKVQENGGVITSSTRAKKEEFPFETLKDFKFRKDNSITHIMQQINEPIEGKNVKKLSYTCVTKWLKLSGYLTEEQDKELNKLVTVPTEKGRELGIYTERREQAGRPAYVVVMYNEEAQYFIAKNMQKIYFGECIECEEGTDFLS